MAVLASAIFAGRNLNKAAKGDWGRYSVAAAQVVNVTNSAANSGIKLVSNTAQKAVKGVDGLGETVFKTANLSGKVARVASKAVNPLLVCAAGIRVAKDSDKKSRAIEEGAALGAMFTGEGVYKLVRNTVNKHLGNTLKEGQKVIKNEAVNNKIALAAKKIGDFVQNSSGKKKALFILAELGFVATSMLCWNLGRKIGTKITGRENSEKNDAPAETGEVKLRVLA